MRSPITLLLPLLALLLTGCGDDKVEGQPAKDAVPAAAEKPWRVLETFNVGEGVYVRSLAVEPKTNALWVGTSVGVLEIDLTKGEPRNTYTREHGLANEYVFSIFVDSQGNRWFGTNGGGVSRLNAKGEWKTYFPLHGLADYWIYSFAEEPDGVLWIGTWAGANRLEVANEKFTTYVKELINEWVYGLGIDSKGRIWFGTEGGVSLYDGKGWQEWSHKDGLGAANLDKLPASSNTGLGTRSRHDLSTMTQGKDTYNPSYVFAIHIDPQDQVWAGTWGGGAARFDGKRWHNLATQDGLAGNIVYSITQTADGALWFGTDKGISRYDGKNWQTFAQPQGLAGNHVYTLVPAADGTLWAGTLGGVTHIGR